MYKATCNLLRNGVKFGAGDIMPENLTEKEISQLLAEKMIEVIEESTEEVEKVKGPKKEKKVIVNADGNVSEDWSKVKLVGTARNLGLTADQTMTKKELVKMIKNAPPAKPIKEVEVPTVTVNDNPRVLPDVEEKKTDVKEEKTEDKVEVVPEVK